MSCSSSQSGLGRIAGQLDNLDYFHRQHHQVWQVWPDFLCNLCCVPLWVWARDELCAVGRASDSPSNLALVSKKGRMMMGWLFAKVGRPKHWVAHRMRRTSSKSIHTLGRCPRRAVKICLWRQSESSQNQPKLSTSRPRPVKLELEAVPSQHLHLATLSMQKPKRSDWSGERGGPWHLPLLWLWRLRCLQMMHVYFNEYLYTSM